MAQVTIYLPEPIATAAKGQAKNQNRSLSAYISELVSREIQPAEWPPDFVALIQDGIGDLIEPEDSPPEEVPEI